MNILTISLVMSCNRSCWYCPVKNNFEDYDFTFDNAPGTPPDTPRTRFNSITYDDLMRWLDKYIRPDEWFIEITGGEPGMHHEIEKILLGLDERKYLGVIKTNGDYPMPKTEGIKIIACWHQDADFPANNYDYILILENPHDDWQGKVEYCKKNKIPYKTTSWDDPEVLAPRDYDYNKTLYHCHVSNIGAITYCAKGFIDSGLNENAKNIHNLTPPIYHSLQTSDEFCRKCKGIHDVEILAPEGVFV